ncbi:MAG TPA: DUF4097 family beta strand repeat-containing protein [Terriglobales bacterium]|nr:DUF4097 family beta strand repeat-containing protein [Terriglobales bacterium]
MKTLFKFAAVLLLLIPLAAAQQTRVYQEGNNWAREIVGSLPASHNLRVKVDAGSVRVEGGSETEIQYVIRNHAHTSSEETARREFDGYKVTAVARGDTASIIAECQNSDAHHFSGEFIIRVPRNMESVRIETDGGNITTTAVAGRVDAESGGGTIRFDDIGGAVRAETGGGSIDVGTVGGDLNLNTGGGSIKIAAAKGKVRASSGGGSVILVSGMQEAVLETGGGNIEVTRCNGQVRATTGGGSIDLGDIGGKAEIETGGGSIRLSSATGPVRAETGSGSIELGRVSSVRAETGAGGIVAKFISSNGERNDSQLETSVGDITVYLAPNINISVRASIEVSNGHRIHSDFPEINIRSEGGDWGPKVVSAEGSLNGGGPSLKVSTTTGDIYFRRLNP